MEAWITANRAGLANTLSEVERRKLLEEVIQNALDTSAKKIDVNLLPPKRGYATLSVEDDDPEGFVDMSLAYEMFADSPKRSDPTKAGRFTIGEKRVLALSRSASIESTKGTILFEIINGKESRTSSRKKRDVGTLAIFEIEMTQPQYEEVCEAVKSIIPHENVVLLFNGEQIQHRKPMREFKAKLPTEYANEARKMVRAKRETEVRLYKPEPWEKPYLYELGIPVVEIDCEWHVDVRQRVPLNTDRDNVTPKYKRTLLALVLNEAYDKLSDDQAVQPWVKDARGSELISKDAFESTNVQIWGEKAVVPDPNDPESVNKAVANGYSVVRGESKDVYENNRRFEIALSSSKVFPSSRPYSSDPNADEAKPIPREKWTEGMILIHAYTLMLSKELLGQELSVRFVNAPMNGFGACFGKYSAITGPQLDYNIGRLGYAWFRDGINAKVDALIIHEFGHWYSDNHLSEDYYKALCDLGARLKELALKRPELFK